MSELETRLDSVLAQAEAREQRARQRAWLFTLLPILFAAALLSVTFWQVNQANQQVAAKNQELQDLTVMLGTTQQSLDFTSAQLNLANGDLSKARADLGDIQNQLSGTRDELVKTRGLLTGVQNQFKTSQDEAAALKKEVESLRLQVDGLRLQLQELQESTRIAQTLREYDFPVEIATTIKEVESRNYDSNRPLFNLLDVFARYTFGNQPGWNPGGASEEEGYNSPAFAAFVLEEAGLRKRGPSPLLSQGELMASLRPRPGQPQPGDIVFYAGGFCMFYFLDENGSPFVIGMTPRQIFAAYPDFTKIIGVGAVLP